MKNILMRLVKDFNEYSELVALNRSKMKEGKCDDSTLQWNRGHLNRIEEYLNDAADSVGITLNWECKEHTFGYDDWKRVLTYRTVNISYEDLEKLTVCSISEFNSPLGRNTIVYVKGKTDNGGLMKFSHKELKLEESYENR